MGWRAVLATYDEDDEQFLCEELMVNMSPQYYDDNSDSGEDDGKSVTIVFSTGAPDNALPQYF